MTIQVSLQAVSLYPVTPVVVQNICDEVGLEASATISQAIRTSSAYKRARAKVFAYLADAPDVTEAGVSYSLTDAQRNQFRAQARAILADIGEEEDSALGLVVGYIGEDL